MVCRPGVGDVGVEKPGVAGPSGAQEIPMYMRPCRLPPGACYREFEPVNVRSVFRSHCWRF